MWVQLKTGQNIWYPVTSLHGRVVTGFFFCVCDELTCNWAEEGLWWVWGEMSDIVKHCYFESSHNNYCIRLCCDMGCDILSEALTWSRFFFAMIKVITHEGYSKLRKQTTVQLSNTQATSAIAVTVMISALPMV